MQYINKAREWLAPQRKAMAAKDARIAVAPRTRVIHYPFELYPPYNRNKAIEENNLKLMPTVLHEVDKYEMTQDDGTVIIVTLKEKDCPDCGGGGGAVYPCATLRCDPNCEYHWGS